VKHVVNFSGGLCSFWAAHRVVQRFGTLDTVLLFADTLVESPNLYAFNVQCSELLGVPITRVSREMTPWQLFRRQKMIGNNRFPICSVMLKREVLDEWMMGNFEMDHSQQVMWGEHASLYLGFDWTEAHRTQAMRKEHPSWSIHSPMQEGEVWDKCRMQREAEKIGLLISPAYKHGFTHDNCGQRCVRAGISHWVHLFRVNLPAFEEWETEEWETARWLEAQGIEPLSMLKDRRGGETKNLYLRDLRTRIESGEKFASDDWGGCGCGGATTATKPPTP
jgi:hypothetical protein